MRLERRLRDGSFQKEGHLKTSCALEMDFQPCYNRIGSLICVHTHCRRQQASQADDPVKQDVQTVGIAGMMKEGT